MNYRERLLRSIPGGAHTYSRGFDQHPLNAPEILSRGEGVYVFDPHGKKYLDYGMGLRSVNIGYSESQIDNAAIRQIKNGTNLTLPSLIELEAAELLIELIDSVDMVKFTKNGSTAVSAAVKLARAYTGRDLVARCTDHPFFSYDDWFISSTPITRGIPRESLGKTKMFQYNDYTSLELLISEYPDQIACVVLEPASISCPSTGSEIGGCCGLEECSRGITSSSDNYLRQIQALCRRNGIVFILDEMITGFRWNLGGAQKIFGVQPDLCTFGKAMANGYPLACVAGKREIMELGSIEHSGQERVFFLSTTHGAEMASLGAFIENINFIKENNVISNYWKYGSKLKKLMNQKANQYGVGSYFKADGPACSPHFTTLDSNGVNSLGLRTLFCQEMIKSGVLIPWISLAFRHTEEELLITELALDATFKVYERAISDGLEKYLDGPVIKPVFRIYN